MAAIASHRHPPTAPAPGSAARQITSFAVIGILSTAAYAGLYLLLRQVLEPVAANALALVVTAVGNTAANRRLTFAVRDRAGALRDQVGGFVALGVALVITTLAAGALGVVAPSAGRTLELTVLVGSNVLATVCRFLILRRWIAGPWRSARAGHRPSAATLPGAVA